MDKVRRYPVTRLELLCVIAFSILIAAILLATRRDGHDWGGDFALYISHARNLAEGRSYAATGYLPNPDFKGHSPGTYPPVFPVLLAPLYARWGLNYNVLKVPGILCFALSIPVLFTMFRLDLPALRASLAVALWAGWPFILEFKDSVLPDLLFTLLFMVALWLLRDTYDRFPAAEPEFWRAGAIGFALYAVYATRSIGIVVPGAAGAYELLRYRRIRRFAVTVLGTFVFFAILQNIAVHNEGSYYRMFELKVLENFRMYAYVLSVLFSGATSGWQAGLRYLLTAVMGVLAVGGFLLAWRRFRSPAELAFIFYAVLLLLWSAGGGIRYIAPIVPLYFFYAMSGLDLLPLPPRSQLALEGALATLALAAYISQYRAYDPRPIAGGVRTPGFAEMCSYVETHTQPGDRLIFENPRVLSLYTRRPAGVYPRQPSPDLMWSYARNIDARYIAESDVLEPDFQTLQPFVDRYSAQLRLVYTNSHFRIFAVQR